MEDKFFPHNFLKKNRKAELSGLVKTIMWVIFFVILSFGVYFLIKNLSNI